MPEIIQVDKDQVVIAWKGDSDSIEYWPLGKTHLTSVAKDEADTKKHEVRILGLEPGVNYSYKIVSKIAGKEDVFHFQTQPLTTSSTSFMLFDSVTSDELLRHLVSDNPGFLLSTTSINETDANEYSDLRPFVVVYDTTGNTAQYLLDQPSSDSATGYRIEWGCLVLAVSEDVEFLQNQIESLRLGYTLGLFTSSATVAKLDFTHLSKHLESSSTIPAFVLLKDSDNISERSGVTFVGIQGDHSLHRITVNPESAYMTELPSGVQTDLRLTPLSIKRTCAECRRLADSGAYEASVKAYIEFIESNEKHHLVDDAYFEVANIYDEKLFDFRKAIEWYSALVEAYPRSSLSLFAGERLKYFNGFEQQDFPALERFEKIRRVSYREADSLTKSKLIKEVLRQSDEQSHSTLAPVMLFWVGNQQRQTNTQQAVNRFQKLTVNYPTHELVPDAFYAVAETLYEANRFKEALKSYETALAKIPDRRKSILVQIDRCTRNMRRHFLIWPALITLLAITIASGYFWRFHERKQWVQSTIIATVVVATLGIWGWTIREQFPSTTVLCTLVSGFALVCSVTPSIVSPLVSSTELSRFSRHAIAGGLCTVTGASGLYALVYFAFEHYLTVFGL